jgi:alkyl hydroperoxide reductase subunit AhpC
VTFFSHPADFTPVCTTEFITFASMQAEFRWLNCELLGLSIDSTFSHIAWLRTIRERAEFRNHRDVEVTFPAISDLTMKVAKAYGTRRGSFAAARLTHPRQSLYTASSLYRVRLIFSTDEFL